MKRARRLLILLSLSSPPCEVSMNLRYENEVSPGQTVEATAEIQRRAG